MRVVLSPNPYRDKGLAITLEAQRLLRQCGVETVLCLPFSIEGSVQVDLPPEVEFRSLRKSLSRADVMVCFGGDGTILHAAKDAESHHVPVLGVNLGGVGFMAELEAGELPLLTKLAQGDYTTESRIMLDVKVLRDGKVVYKDLALNDAVVTKGAMARVLDLSVYGDNVLISEVTGDGVILSTPTGSTAYSMSAGGPIVEPTAENIIFTPICAHILHARSFVLDAKRTVSVRLGKDSRRSAYLSTDGGRAFKLQPGDTVEATRSHRQTRLVRLTGRSFYDILSQKLGKV